MAERPVRFRLRRRTAADWTSVNEVLLSAEAGLETDTRRVKYGDGVTAWNSLPYAETPPSDGDKGDIVVSGSGTVWSIDAGVIVNADVNASAGIVFSKMAALTASRGLVSDGSGVVSVATTTATEIGYVNGVTSAIQTQLDAKAPLASPTFTGTLTTAGMRHAGTVVMRVENTAASIPSGTTGQGLELSSNNITSYNRTSSGYGSLAIDALTIQLRPSASVKLLADATQVTISGSLKLPSYTVGTVPAAGTHGAGAMIYVSNETGGAVPAFSDATNWRRVTDRAVVS